MDGWVRQRADGFESQCGGPTVDPGTDMNGREWTGTGGSSGLSGEKRERAGTSGNNREQPDRSGMSRSEEAGTSGSAVDGRATVFYVTFFMFHQRNGTTTNEKFVRGCFCGRRNDFGGSSHISERGIDLEDRGGSRPWGLRVRKLCLSFSILKFFEAELAIGVAAGRGDHGAEPEQPEEEPDATEASIAGPWPTPVGFGSVPSDAVVSLKNVQLVVSDEMLMSQFPDWVETGKDREFCARRGRSHGRDVDEGHHYSRLGASVDEGTAAAADDLHQADVDAERERAKLEASRIEAEVSTRNLIAAQEKARADVVEAEHKALQEVKVLKAEGERLKKDVSQKDDYLELQKTTITDLRTKLQTWREVYKEKGELSELQSRLIDALWESPASKVELLWIKSTPEGAVHEQLTQLLESEKDFTRQRLEWEDAKYKLSRDLNEEKEEQRREAESDLFELREKVKETANGGVRHPCGQQVGRESVEGNIQNGHAMETAKKEARNGPVIYEMSEEGPRRAELALPFLKKIIKSYKEANSARRNSKAQTSSSTSFVLSMIASQTAFSTRTIGVGHTTSGRR
ncbi:hypothetical protein R1sor_027009 [Riccia sorocarpa]|uniref:Uncharacterized protein n=1 Tax=Riccia sorocarpa TaxID=122646 RepID=A0ABD3GEI0_9MARC